MKFSTMLHSVVFGMGYQGAAKLIASMVDAGPLSEYGERNDSRRFHAPALTDVLLRRRDETPPSRDGF